MTVSLVLGGGVASREYIIQRFYAKGPKFASGPDVAYPGLRLLAESGKGARSMS